MKWRAEVRVMLKDTVSDPQGETLQRSLVSKGYDVSRVRAGKFLQLELTGYSREDIVARLEEICSDILSNPVIEDYEYDLEEVLE